MSETTEILKTQFRYCCVFLFLGGPKSKVVLGSTVAQVRG